MTITPTSFPLDNHWRLKLLFFGNFLASLLLLSFFHPYTVLLWKKIDIAFFQWINFPLKKHHLLRLFYAFANHQLADWVEDLCILGFYVAAIWKIKKEKRLEKTAQLIFCILFTACIILLINRLLCRDLLRLRRASPTLVIPEAVYLSHFISWLPIKVDSSKSFPGDHATTALMFACSYAYFVRGKLALLALVYGFLLCLPRLAVGAHWLSDILVGSSSIILFSLSWAFFTPFANRCIFYLTRWLLKLKNHFSHKKKFREKD